MMMLSAVFVFLSLCSLQMTAVSRPTCQLQGDLINRSYNHLMNLGGDFPSSCVPYNRIISFPSLTPPTRAAGRPSRSLSCPRALRLMNETLWGSWGLFQEPGVPEGEEGLTWNRGELEHFMGVWHNLLRQTSCLSSVGGSGSDVLTPYFSNLTAVVQQQDSAACGWMALRRDLLTFLRSMLHRNRTCFFWSPPRGRAHV